MKVIHILRLKFLSLIILSISGIVFIYSCKDSAIKQESKTTIETPATDYRLLGKNIVAETQAVLAKNLTNAIGSAGTEYALEFCNTKAIHLTDSMAQALHAGLKRVTDKPRNATNQADESELEIINQAKEKLQKGEQPEPVIMEKNGKIVGLYPIMTNQMCLQCHGKKDTDIKVVTMKKLNALYPQDKATGYAANEVRGMWVVEMDKK